MCLAVVALNASADYPFICIANRDEFHNRPTLPLHPWQTDSIGLWAGKDLQLGGTWLGLGNNSEFALLTNVRNSELNMPGNSPSRGALVVNAIQNRQGPTPEEAVQYAGFNLIHGSLLDLQMDCKTNQGLRLANNTPFSTALQPGLHSLSNGHLDAPWPKAELLKKNLKTLLEVHADSAGKGGAGSLLELEASLLKLLGHTGLAGDAELPSTGVPYEWEKMLSAIKIVSPHYGTRSSAMLLLDRASTIHFTELTFSSDGNEIGRQRFEIPLAPNKCQTDNSAA